MLLTSLTVQAQQEDFILTLQGDTIPCRLMPDPRQEGIRIKRSRGINGFGYVVAEFGTDSVRVLYPGEIWGFIKRNHHQRLPHGTYLSVQENIPTGALFGTNRNEPEPLFQRVLVDGPLYRLLYDRYWDGEDALPRYWIESLQNGERRYLRGLGVVKRWLRSCIDEKEMPKLPRGLRKSFYRFQQLVRQANVCQLPWPPPT